MIVFEDNEGAIHSANNPLRLSGSKHINFRYHFISHEIRVGTILVEHIKSLKHGADTMTKGLPQEVVKGRRRFILEVLRVLLNAKGYGTVDAPH